MSRLVCTLVSHPFEALPSQFAHPVLHTGLHTPAAQEVVPCALVHVTSHPPQSSIVVRLVPHPLFGLPSQSPHPMLQVGVQAPATHAVVPFGLVHTVPHAPQLATLVWVLTSQPLTGLPSQFWYPVAQLGTHTPLVQVVVPLGFVHVVVQVPQV